MFISIVVLIFIGATPTSFALGLGEVRVRTMLGQTFLAHVDLLGDDIENLSGICVKARVLSMDEVLIANLNTVINEGANRKSMTFTSSSHIKEPAVKLVIDVGCGSHLHREFAILLDPPDAMQGAASQIQINPPMFGVQTIPDLVSIPKSSQVVSSTPLSKSKKSNRQNSGDDNASLSEARAFASPHLNPSNDNAFSTQNKSNRSKSKKQNKSTKDVLMLSDDVLIYPPSKGLVMSDILSTPIGQELIQNREELRLAQARMAAILRDEAPVSDSAAPQQDMNLNQLNELSHLRQEAVALRKQALNNKTLLSQLKNNKDSTLWIYILSFVLIIVLGVCAFMFVYIRRYVASDSRRWWEGHVVPDSTINHEDITDIIDEVQASDREYTSKVNSISQGGKSANKEQHSIRNESKNDSNETEEPTTLNSPSQNYTPTLEETNSSIFNFFLPHGSSVKVEEISDITQEAEFWISMNDHQRAIEILSPQEKIENPDSPMPWLFLLELYKTVNDKSKYDQLKDRFVEHFNAKIPSFDTLIDHTQDRHLEDFSHVIDQVCQLWNHEKMIPYLESLLVDDREGKRMGFELSVYSDILMILGVAHELERIKVVEGQYHNALTTSDKAPFPNENGINPLDEVNINTIEFEMIDFPIQETPPK